MPSPNDPTPSLTLSAPTRRRLHWCLLFALLVRLICMIVVPLTDTTEARYAEIARKMLETGDWITPQHDYGIPFWAKPPLSTWLSALSMKLLGVNEWAARLPSLLLAIAMLALVWQWVAARRGRDYALLVSVVLASGLLFFVAAGAVMTDSSLAVCTTLAMVAFWQALHTQDRRWGYVFFIALGLGLLAKGPLVGVLTFLPILPWVALRGNWRSVWQGLPWIVGSLLMLAIALPWYLLAEHKTPGFLQYFIIGEHIKRFLDPGWSGDRYGHAHAEPLGMIWVYWFGSTLPWSPILLGWLLTRARQWRSLCKDNDGFGSYLLLWSITSLVFFTIAHNIIWPYALPTLPAFAVLAVELYARGQRLVAAPARVNWGVLMAVIVPICLLGVGGLYLFKQDELMKSSRKDMALFYVATRPTPDSQLLMFKRRYYSAEFYSAGCARVGSNREVAALLANHSVDYLALRDVDKAELEPALLAHFTLVRQFDDYILLKENAVSADSDAHSGNCRGAASISTTNADD